MDIMGLDNFWQLPENSKPIKFRPNLHLCGGMLSSNGDGSFRGKVYAEVIEGVSGISIYQDLTNEQVNLVASALLDTSYKHAKKHSCWGLTPAEYKDLQRMFSSYAKAGAVLKAWF